eukprot:892939-Pleurochrysis_carterae.AAC.3
MSVANQLLSKQHLRHRLLVNVSSCALHTDCLRVPERSPAAAPVSSVHAGRLVSRRGRMPQQGAEAAARGAAAPWRDGTQRSCGAPSGVGVACATLVVPYE